jgi:hypothetical protein
MLCKLNFAIRKIAKKYFTTYATHKTIISKTFGGSSLPKKYRGNLLPRRQLLLLQRLQLGLLVVAERLAVVAHREVELGQQDPGVQVDADLGGVLADRLLQAGLRLLQAVLRIHDILVWIWIRIPGSADPCL